MGAFDLLSGWTAWAPFASIFGNVMQVCVAGVMVVILIPIIRKAIIK